MHDYETAKFESSQTDDDKDSCLLGYYTVLMSSSFSHFRGAVLLQNEANILQTQKNNPESLDLANVAYIPISANSRVYCHSAHTTQMIP
jgi:hypothetical protein